MKITPRITVIYVLLTIYLIVGFVLSYAGAESYPALVFPGFKEVGSTDGMMQFEKPEITAFASGKAIELSTADLLPGIMPANHPTIFLQRFRYPNGQGGKQVSTRLGGMNVAVKVVPRNYPPAVVQAWESHIDQAITQATGENADSVVIQWYQLPSRPAY